VEKSLELALVLIRLKLYGRNDVAYLGRYSYVKREVSRANDYCHITFVVYSLITSISFIITPIII